MGKLFENSTDSKRKLVRVFFTWTWAYRKIPKSAWSHFQVIQYFFLSEVHFITSKVDSHKVVDSDPNDNYPKEATVGYVSKNISYYFMWMLKQLITKLFFSWNLSNTLRLLLKIDSSCFYIQQTRESCRGFIVVWFC